MSQFSAILEPIIDADGSHDRWAYRVVNNPNDVPAAIRGAAEERAVRGRA